MKRNSAIVNSDNQRFGLAFSEKAIRHNSIMAFSMILPVIVIVLYVGISSVPALWFAIAITFLSLLALVYMQIYMTKLVKESYMEITDEGLLKYKCKGRKEVCYPVNRIKSIEKSTLEQAGKKHAIFPVVLNSHGSEVYPSEGVLITFDRAWIKSVFPIYFNPVDIDGFISAINRHGDRLIVPPSNGEAG